MRVSGKQIPFFVPVVVLLGGIVIAALPSFGADAVETITSRSLTLSSSSANASNATTSYTFSFTVTATTPIQSVGIQICDQADGPCTNDGTTGSGGFSNASATLASQPLGLGATSGWTMRASPPTQYELDIVNASNSTDSSGSQTIVFNNVQNPTIANKTFFARITTYSDAFTTAVDNGVVAAATANAIVLSGTMPESLMFCTGGSVGETNSIPDCATASSGNVNFNQDFSPSSTAYATSQMAASTNANSGYAITVSGNTLKSGTTNSIPALNTADFSKTGTGQFGMNLALDTAANAANPPLTTPSADITPSGGSYQNGRALTGFDTGGDAATAQYQFDPSTTNNIADSAGAATDPQIYTSTYIVNVAGHQGAGTYTTTLTYICTPQF